MCEEDGGSSVSYIRTRSGKVRITRPISGLESCLESNGVKKKKNGGGVDYYYSFIKENVSSLQLLLNMSPFGLEML